MEDNNTIIQLNDALNQLLDAYDSLREENDQLQATIDEQAQTIEKLEYDNGNLEERVEALTSTTKHHSTELDTMLGRIKSTLGATAPTQEVQTASNNDGDVEPEEQTQSEDIQITMEESTIFTQEEPKQEEKKETTSSKEIDLGRMQSLLNGFNS